MLTTACAPARHTPISIPRSRPSLAVRTKVLAQRIVMEGRRAAGVEIDGSGRPETLHAGRRSLSWRARFRLRISSCFLASGRPIICASTALRWCTTFTAWAAICRIIWRSMCSGAGKCAMRATAMHGRLPRSWPARTGFSPETACVLQTRSRSARSLVPRRTNHIPTSGIISFRFSWKAGVPARNAAASACVSARFANTARRTVIDFNFLHDPRDLDDLRASGARHCHAKRLRSLPRTG